MSGTVLRENIVLAVGEEREVNTSLVVGQMKQKIVVEEQATQAATATSTVSGLISQTQMRELPLNGRNFEQLITLASGVVPVTNAASSAYIGRSQVYSFFLKMRLHRIPAVLCLCITTLIQATEPKSPQQYFGFQMGADYKLVAWSQIVEYFYMIIAVISSPANFAKLDLSQPARPCVGGHRSSR